MTCCIHNEVVEDVSSYFLNSKIFRFPLKTSDGLVMIQVFRGLVILDKGLEESLLILVEDEDP